MRKTVTALILSLGLVITFITSGATAPFTQPSPLINIPTSDILKRGEIEMGVSGLGKEDEYTEADGWINFGLFDKVEVGVVFLTPYEVMGNIKVNLFEEKDSSPAFSIGLMNISDKERIASTGDNSPWKPQNYSLYAVVGKEIPYLGKGYLGIGNRWFEGHGSEDKKGLGIFLGLKKAFKPLTLLLEYDGKDTNAGMEFEFSQGIKFKAALTELGYLNEKYRDTLEKEIRFGVGISFTNSLFVSQEEKIKKAEEKLRQVELALAEAKKVAKEKEITLAKIKQEEEKLETYIVKKGDCLWFIAGYKQIYANPFLWKRIWKANIDKIKNPDLVYPYQHLKIPRD